MGGFWNVNLLTGHLSPPNSACLCSLLAKSRFPTTASFEVLTVQDTDKLLVKRGRNGFYWRGTVCHLSTCGLRDQHETTSETFRAFWSGYMDVYNLNILSRRLAANSGWFFVISLVYPNIKNSNGHVWIWNAPPQTGVLYEQIREGCWGLFGS